MEQVVLVYNKQVEKWYLANKEKPKTPIRLELCDTRDQLRWQLSHFNFAVNGPVVWIDEQGMVEE